MAVWLGANVRQLREAADLGQAELSANVSHILGRAFDPSALSRLESGKRNATIDEAAALAEALDVPLTDLTRPPAQVHDLIRFDVCEKVYTRASRAIHAATFDLLEAQAKLAHLAERIGGPDALRAHGRHMTGLDVQPEARVAEGRAEYDRLERAVAEHEDAARGQR